MVYKETQIAIETEIDTGVVTISYDEKPSIQALGCTVEDEPMTEKHGFIARDSDYIRHGTVTLLAGMDLVTGEIIPLVRETHTSDDFIDFLKKVDGLYEEDPHRPRQSEDPYLEEGHGVSGHPSGKIRVRLHAEARIHLDRRLE